MHLPFYSQEKVNGKNKPSLYIRSKRKPDVD